MEVIRVDGRDGVGHRDFYGNTGLIPDLRDALRMACEGQAPLLRAHIYANRSTRGLYYHKFKTVDGQRVNRSTGIPVDQPELAQYVADDLLKQEFEQLSPKKYAPPTLLSQLFELVIRDLEDTGRSEGQIKNMKASKYKLIEAFGDVPFCSLDFQDFQAYIKQRTVKIDGGCFIRRADNNALREARTAFGYAVHNAWIKQHFLNGLRFPKILPSNRDSLNHREFCEGIDMYRAKSYTEGVAQLSAMVLMYTGLRPSELRRVKLEHIDFVDGYLDMSEQMNLPVKNRQVTLLPLSEPALWALRQLRLLRADLLAPSKPRTAHAELILGLHGKPISGRTFSAWFTTFAREAWPTKRLTLYSFRRAFATSMMEAGLAAEDVALAMGKASWDTTIVYMNTTRSERLSRTLPFIRKLPVPVLAVNY